ncbi:MAG: hypothetical protein JWL85_344 [Candidatus Saccharibacteria bacterium]|nr:hypothetical protein [Candidatus Saccharibacteria bacterium]
MTIKEQIDQDLKQAMLAGNKTLAMTLRGLKSVILYAEVAKGTREQGSSDQEVIDLFAKEAKKRQESADLYRQGGNEERAVLELEEKKVIEQYLPQQMSDEDLNSLVDQAVAELGAMDMKQMGQVIALVKERSQNQADGGRIAKAVKERLN